MLRLSSSKNPITKSHRVTRCYWHHCFGSGGTCKPQKSWGKKRKNDKTPRSKTAPPTAQKLSCNVGHSIPDHPRHLHLKARPTKDEIHDEIFRDLYRSLIFLNVFFFFQEISEFLSVHHLLLPLELGPWPLKNVFCKSFLILRSLQAYVVNSFSNGNTWVMKAHRTSSHQTRQTWHVFQPNCGHTAVHSSKCPW